MAVGVKGIVNPFDMTAHIPTDVSIFTKQFFINRTPLFSRFPREAIGTDTFTIARRRQRKRKYALGDDLTDSATTVTLASGDAAPLIVGDVLEIDTTGERIEITADPNVNANTATIVRGVGSVAAAAADTGDALTLIGNSRTGGEVDQNGQFVDEEPITQYIQHFQHPVQVAGALLDTNDLRLPDGDTDLLNSEQKRKLRDMYEDIEVSAYLGQPLSKDASGTGRPKMAGLRNLIAPANVITDPVNKAAYKATDFSRDVLKNPDVDTVLVSNEFRIGLTEWGHPLQRLQAGATSLGTAITAFESPFANGAIIIPCPLLPPYTAVGLAASDVRWRTMRQETWSPRGIRGDAREGDWIARFAIELSDPELHTWVQGVTGFAAS